MKFISFQHSRRHTNRRWALLRRFTVARWLRVFDDAGDADGFVIARAIHYAVQNGADVINMSFGMVSDMKVVKQAVAFAVQRGVTVVASAGNASTDGPQSLPAWS